MVPTVTQAALVARPHPFVPGPGPGRPRTRPDQVVAAYWWRNIVARLHRLEQWRGIAIRYDERPHRYLAASTLIRLDA